MIRTFICLGILFLTLNTESIYAAEDSNLANHPTLYGRVFDYRNEPVPGAQVWVSRNREVHTVQSNEQGKFKIDNLEPGKMSIVAYKEGLSFGGKEIRFLGDEVWTIVLDNSKDLNQRIINARFKPVEGARLKSITIGQRFTIQAEDLIAHGFPNLVSNKDGIMAIPDMPRFGVISVTVSHPDYADSILPTFPVGTDIDLVMTDGIKLRGRITNKDGEGVERSRVSLFKVYGGRNQKYTEVLTDNDGFYTINAPPARYFVAARHPKYAVPKPAGVWLRAGVDEVIQDLSLSPAYVVHGKTLTKTGEAVPLTAIAYQTEDGTTYAQTTSGRDGKYTLVVPKGKGTLVVTPPKRMMNITAPKFSIEIKNKLNTEIENIVLEALPEITGVVSDNSGKPVPNAFVRTFNIEPAILTQSDKNGHFSVQLEQMDNVKPVELYIEHPSRFLRSIVPIDLKKNTPLAVKLKNYRPNLGRMPELSLNNLYDLVDLPAPEWTCQDWFNLPEGKETLTLEDYKGKVLILTLWAAFDINGTSQERIKELNYLHEVYKDNDKVAFLGIHDAGLKPFEIELVVKRRNIPFPIGCDTDEFETFQQYDVNQIPQTIIIDAKGHVKYYEVDGRLHTLIKAMLRKR